jgi:hypothetical protein
MPLAFITPHSPIWPWLVGLLEASRRREIAAAQHRETGRLDIHVLTPFEILAWGAAAAKSRGPN